MKATRFKTMAVLLVGMALAVAACGTSETDEDDNTTNGGRHSGKLGRAEALVDSVRNEVNWAKAKQRYDDAKYAIDKLKSPTQRKNLTSLLNRNYCHSMDTIMQIIMGKSECEKYHGKKKNGELYAIHGERAKYSDINSPLHTQVEKTYKDHEDMLSFIANAVTWQNVTSWSTPYDEKTENDKKREAQNYLNTKPSCKKIIDGLNNIKSGAVFKSRRKNYCEKILELYLQKETYSPQDERALRGRLNSTYGSILDEWENKINGFKEEKNNQNQ